MLLASAWLVLALLAGAPSMLPAQPRPADRFETVRSLIREAMEEHRLPAVAVAVAKDGRILWEEGLGWADLERRIPATPQTMFSLASISKPITATAILRLAEQGQLNLDRPANDYLGEGRIRSRVWDPAGATVRRVLSHTAGLPLHYEFFYEGEARPARTADEGIARFGVLVNPPGELYEYSNLGYGVLDRIIEQLSGQSYAEYLQAEVFQPLGMTHSVVSTGAELGERAAVRYDRHDRPIAPYDFDHRGGSAVYSSVNDLVRFGMFHLGNPVPGQLPVLSDATRRAMQEVATPGSPEQGYGLGWIVGKGNGYLRVAHTGGMPGVSTVLDLYPEENLALVVLTNKSNRVVLRIAQEIAAAMLPRHATALSVQEGRPVTNSTSSVPSVPVPELLGEWSGTVHTYEGTIPLTLHVHASGAVDVELDRQLCTIVNPVVFRDAQLVGRFTGTISTEDTRRRPHTVLLNLRLREGRLIGAATAQTLEDPISFALSSFVELEKQLD
jgi:CubicO group peptidase (beta-lactamase class C family)